VAPVHARVTHKDVVGLVWHGSSAEKVLKLMVNVKF
jgi:hypothetical protein